MTTAKGRRPVSAAKKLIGKHFAYKNRKRGRYVVFVDKNAKLLL